MADQNLSSKDITAWKNSVDNAITKKLVVSLDKVTTDVLGLYNATKSQNENNLNYRYKDLYSLTKQASAKLKAKMKTFDEELTKYINTVKSAENKADEATKKKIDQFAEKASEISKL